jgi:hypothetical protein
MPVLPQMPMLPKLAGSSFPTFVTGHIGALIFFVQPIEFQTTLRLINEYVEWIQHYVKYKTDQTHKRRSPDIDAGNKEHQ